MNIRNAKAADVRDINSLICSYAETDRMLFRSVADIYEYLQMFMVAESADTGSEVVGCCGLHVVWAELAEIKSLAVKESSLGRGIGKALVSAAIEKAEDLGMKKVFTLTLEPAFFEKLGFTRVDKDTLPMKVWSDCARCSKQDNCDETALVYSI